MKHTIQGYYHGKSGNMNIHRCEPEDADFFAVLRTEDSGEKSLLADFDTIEEAQDFINNKQSV